MFPSTAEPRGDHPKATATSSARGFTLPVQILRSATEPIRIVSGAKTPIIAALEEQTHTASMAAIDGRMFEENILFIPPKE